MTTTTKLDYSISEPGSTASEIEMLLFAIDRSRATFAYKVGELDAAGLSRAFPPSLMTLGGLVKHMALVEDKQVSVFVTGEPLPAPWDARPANDNWDWCWSSADQDTPEELYALWTTSVERSRAVWTAVLAEGGPEAPSKAQWGDFNPNLRRALVDLHDEYARHLGHADLFREAIDGRVGEDPPQD